MKNQRGFTLVELVMTMILISILAVTVLPKLFGPSEFAVYAIRDQLIGQLRLSQLQALNRRGTTQNLLVKPDKFGLARSTTDTETQLSSDENSIVDLDGVSIKLGASNDFSLRFDSHGKITAGSVSCDGGCTLTLIGSETLKITIESEGYVHESS
ncbi:MAG: type II secretion system protein [Gammaproteobacteria bacterium]|nr:type II secretion system protein [Gammaproteobacteria bacterium]